MVVTQLIQSTNGLPDNAAEETIRLHDFPLNEQARRHLDDLIEAVVAMVRNAFLRRKREERAEAQATLITARAQRAGQAPHVLSAQTEYADCPGGSCVLAVLLTPFCLACLAMEFILSWVTLPLLFGVAPKSPLGVMLGLGPTGAVAVLKIFIARLVEDPYQRLSRGMSRTHRVGVLAVMVTFAVTLAAFNVYALVLQADVREAVAQAARQLRSTKSAAATYQPIDSHDAVVAVSVAAAVDGAVFFLVAWNEAHLWRRRRSAFKSLRRARARAQDLDAAVARAETTVTAQLQENIEEAAVVAGSRRRAELQIACDLEEGRQRQSRSMKETVDRELRVM